MMVMLAGAAMDADWNDYVESFHRERAGVTEEVLRDARLGTLDPYSWLSAAVTPTGGPVVDIASGSGPVAATFARWIGIDRSADELRIARGRGRSPLVRATAAALPIRTGGSDVALCVMSLQILSPLDAAFGELARLLRPGGQLVVLLPARRPLPVRDLAFYARLQRRLGQAIAYPNDDRLGGTALAALAAAHGFAVEDDVRAGFVLRLPCRADAERFVHSLYLPGVAAARVDRAVALVERRVGRSVTVPLRRVVLRRRTSTAERTLPAPG
jgi:SAM-dependent methyltransferase